MRKCNSLEKPSKVKSTLNKGVSLNVAICGIRGIPACYGGFETFAEELSTRLVQRGHSVRVYGRSHVIDFQDPTYKGVEIVRLPAPRHKYLETPLHTILCLLHLLFKPVDVVLVCNAANSPFIWLARLRGMPVALNLDGIERHRAKWNSLGKLWYRIGERFATWFATELISDAKVIYEYYRQSYGRESKVIPYGFAPVREEAVEQKLEECFERNPPILERFSLNSGEYLLYVSRLEPENNAHVVINAYKILKEQGIVPPLVVVGDAPYAKEYIRKLHESACEGVIFTGYLFGQDYFDLQVSAKVYIQATEVGGTHPALVEAMGFANCIIANSTPENREVLGDAGLYYKKNSEEELARQLANVCEDPKLLQRLRKAARSRALKCYEWESITSDYEDLLDLLHDPLQSKSAQRSPSQGS